MTNDEFNVVLDERMKKIQATLKRKALEYATEDRLYNFKRAAEILGISDFEALLSMMAKHLVSVLDIVHNAHVRGVYPDSCTRDEKIGDLINYFILLEAMLIEHGGKK